MEENYQNAYEHTPELFSSVTMLYVDMEVVCSSLSLHVSALREAALREAAALFRVGTLGGGNSGLNMLNFSLP